MSTTNNKGGLEGVTAGTSSVCEVDGIGGKLTYRGIDIHDLAANSTFEETAYLLWAGELPTRQQLSVVEDRLSCCRDLPHGVIRMIRDFPQTAEPMMVLRTAVSALGMFDPEGRSTTTTSISAEPYSWPRACQPSLPSTIVRG